MNDCVRVLTRGVVGEEVGEGRGLAVLAHLAESHGHPPQPQHPDPAITPASNPFLRNVLGNQVVAGNACVLTRETTPPLRRRRPRTSER